MWTIKSKERENFIMFAYKTDIGKVRKRNEDSAFIIENRFNDLFMLIFDGMGGHNRGDVASSLAQKTMVDEFQKKEKFNGKFDMYFWLKKVILKTNKILNDYSHLHNDSKGMGTTFSCYLIHKNLTLMCYIGDTRCYLINNNEIKQESIDETYVEFLYESGKITQREKQMHPQRNIITNALGCYNSVIINLRFINKPYTHLLLCSDGLYKMVNEETISKIILQEDSLENKIDKLIDLANAFGGHDNIAIALYEKEREND